ncbi:MAG: creatininase family protein [Anaerolineae bacterium]
MKLLTEEMTWPQIKKAIEDGYVSIIVPIGSIEQHGLHLPTGTDTFIGYNLAVRIAEKLGKALVAPTIRPGCSDHHMNFAGTISISSALLGELVGAYCRSLIQHGFKNILLLPTHGGNFSTVARITPQLDEELPGRIAGFADLKEFTRVQDAILAPYGITPAQGGAHAGRAETSWMLGYRGDLVDLDRAEAGFLGDFEAEMEKIKPSEGGFAMRMEQFSAIGVLGDPVGSQAEIGRELLEGMAEYLADFFRKALG